MLLVAALFKIIQLPDALLNAANASAASASANWANLSPSISLGNVTTDQTINRVNNITVVQINSLNYNSNTITLVGLAGQDDAFSFGVYDSDGIANGTDTDGDGMRGGYTNAANVADNFNGFGGRGIRPIDSDNDGKPDAYDIDSDNDGIPDNDVLLMPKVF